MKLFCPEVYKPFSGSLWETSRHSDVYRDTTRRHTVEIQRHVYKEIFGFEPTLSQLFDNLVISAIDGHHIDGVLL